MAITDARSLPLAIYTTSAQCAEASLVIPTLRERVTYAKPYYLLADRQYDSEPLDSYLLEEEDIVLIAPHDRNRVRKPTQDGRVAKRLRRRWTIERFFAWLQKFRRLVVRYEYYILNFEAFLMLGCVLIYLRYL